MIGERLLDLRKDAGLTQDELAGVLNINKHSISSYERDKSEPPDIIKIAMNRVYKRLLDEKLRSRLVLQVHDELLIETWKDEIPQVSRILEEEMKGAANLAVELEVDMHQGNNWYEAK